MAPVVETKAELRKLMADDEDAIGLAGHAEPAVLDQLPIDDVVELAAMGLEDSRVLGHSPEHGLLPECQGAGRVVSVVAEQYGVHPRYGVEMAAVHDVLPHDRISPRLAKFFQVGISLNAGLAGFPPIAPDLAAEHLVNQLLEGRLENAWCAGETMVGRKLQRVGHVSKLIAVGGKILRTADAEGNEPRLRCCW
jgi:hypothetical protein